MYKFIDEILLEVQNAPTDEDKIVILKKYSSMALQQLLYANFSKRIKFLLPDTPATFVRDTTGPGLAASNLNKEMKKMYLFVENGNVNITQSRREQLWIQLLESIPFNEAKLIEVVKNKKLEENYGISLKVVRLAFPELLKPVDLEEKKIVTEEGIKPKRKRGRKPNKDIIESF